MKHPLIIRSLQYPLVGFLAIVTALVVVYPTYWERVAAAASVTNPSQVTSISPWTEQERDEARERARLAITLPPLRLDQVDVGDRADMETMLETLSSETITEVRPIQVDTLPAGGVLYDPIVDGKTIFLPPPLVNSKISPKTVKGHNPKEGCR